MSHARGVDAVILCGLPPDARAVTSRTPRADAAASADGRARVRRRASTTADEGERARARWFRPGVLDAVARADARWPKELAESVMPRGVDAYDAGARTSDDDAERYPTILTDEKGERVYVACVSFIAAAPERSLVTMTEWDWTPARARACVCLVSRAPCLDAWMEALWHMFEAYVKRANGHLPALSTIVDGLVERLTWRAERSVLFPVGGALVAVPPHGAACSVNREAFVDGKELLFRCLTVQTIIQCVMLIACERRLLLRSQNVSLVVKCAETLRSLAHPLVWRHVYVPCVSTSMVDYVAAPMPYIMGISADIVVNERNLDGVAVLDLDQGTLHDGDDRVLMPPADMLHSLTQRLREVLHPGVVHVGDTDADAVSCRWSMETNRRLTDIFTDFWYDLLQLDSLEKYVKESEDAHQLKINEYNNALGVQRCHLTDQIVETNAFMSLLNDVHSLMKRTKSKSEDRSTKSRAKFRSTQLMGNSRIPVSSSSLCFAKTTMLVPRLHELDFDEEEAPETLLQSLSLHEPPQINSMVDTKPDKQQMSELTPVGALRRAGTKPASRASWGWVKDKLKRKVLSRDEFISVSERRLDADKASVKGEDAIKFEWYYNTLTKEDANTLAGLVRLYRDRLSGEDVDEMPESISPSASMHSSEPSFDLQEDNFDAVTALVYPIFNDSDVVIASALAEHTANVNYPALLTGVERYLVNGSKRYTVISTAIRAVVVRADAAGDAKSLARVMAIVRKYQPAKCHKLWLQGSTRWAEVNLWRGLIKVNTHVRWLEGADPQTQTEDLIRCFAIVGLTSAQSAELLNQLNFSRVDDKSDLLVAGIEGGVILSPETYASISFESWVESLRESSAVHFGVKADDDLEECESIPDCCPFATTETEIWKRTAITAINVQSGVVSSLVALGSGKGDIAFFAPDTNVLTRSQSQSETRSAFSALTFVPRSSRVFCGRRDGAIEIWDSTTCTRLSVLKKAHKGKKISFVSPVVNQVISSAPLTASAGDDGTVKLWDARQSDDRRAVSVIAGHEGGVSAFATRDARGGAVGSILTGDEGGVVRAWDPRHAGAGPVALAKAHHGRVTCLAPLQRSDTTASAGADGSVRILRLDGVEGGNIRLSGHLGDISSLAVIQDDTRGRQPVGLIASGSRDGELCLWSGGEHVKDVRQPWRCVSKSRAHFGTISCLAVESSGRARRASLVNTNSGGMSQTGYEVKSFLSASMDRSFACWNLKTARIKGTVTATSWTPATMHASPRTTEASCGVIEPSKRRFLSGDRYGVVTCASLSSTA